MRLLISGLIAALVALSSATPAVARDYVHTDGSGDMWTAQNADPYVQSPGQVEGDITRVQMRHTRSHVQLFMTVREAKRETLNTFFYFTLQNGRKKLTQVNVGTYRHFGKPDGALTIEDSRYRNKKCRGLKGFKINWETNTVAITIPRTCVGRPKLLRVKPYLSLNYDTLDDYADAGHSALDPFYHWQPWSPWVRRG